MGVRVQPKRPLNRVQPVLLIPRDDTVAGEADLSRSVLPPRARPVPSSQRSKKRYVTATSGTGLSRPP